MRLVTVCLLAWMLVGVSPASVGAAVRATEPQEKQSEADAAGDLISRGDYETALKKLQPLAQKGDAHAQYLLGFMYFNGMGVERSLPEVTKWLRLASDQGHEYARLLLGICLNAAGDFAESAKILRWAADKGETSAQNLLGAQYLNGKGVPVDEKEAARLFKLAADQGDSYGQLMMGELALQGKGMPQDYKLAEQYLRLAAKQGQTPAQVLLGTMLYSGEGGIAVNTAEAMGWWQKAAASGDETGEYYLGIAYSEGKATQRDDVEAARRFRAAAEKGDAGGQYRLGSCYFQGLGVTKNLVQSLAWLRLAEEQKFSGSSDLAKKVAAEMTPEQISAADLLVKEWRARH